MEPTDFTIVSAPVKINLSAAASHDLPRGRHSKKRSPLSGSGRGGRDVVTVYPVQLALVVITAVWAGLNIGHLLTLWQVEAKNRNDQGNDSDK